MRLLLKQVKEQEKKLAQKELAHMKQLERDKDDTLAKKAEVEGKQAFRSLSGPLKGNAQPNTVQPKPGTTPKLCFQRRLRV